MPAATTVAQLAVVVSADTSAAEAGLTSLGTKVGNAGSALQTAFAGAAVAGIAGVAAGLAASVTAATDFEKTMSGVKAVSGATAEEMAAVTSTALDLGAKTAFSASEAGKGIEELVKGGLTISEAMTAAKATLDLAAAGGISVADSATIAANALAQFSLPAEKMAHVSDLIAGAANASALDVSQFKFSLQAAGAVAATVGFSFDDLAQGIAVMGKAGITGSDAGTSLKTMMLNLVPSTKKASQLMQELGIITADGANQFFDATGKVKSMADVAQVLQTALQGQTEAQKISTLNTLFGSDAIRAAAVLAKEGASGFNDMAAAMGKVSAESVGAEKLNNLAGSVEQLKGSLETMAITVGLELLPILKDFVDALTQAANDAMPAMQQAAKDVAATLQSWMPTIKAVSQFLWDNRDAVLAVIAALATFVILTTVVGWITTIVTAISGLITIISGAGGVMAALGGLVAILGGPVTLIIAAIALAVGVLALAWSQNWGDIQGKTAAVVDFLSGVPSMVEGFFTDIGHAAEGLQMAVGAAWDAITTATETVWNGIKDFLTTWWREILVVLTGPVGALAVLIIDNWQTIADTTTTIWNAIKNILIAIFDLIYTEVVEPKLTAIAQLVSTTWDAIKTTADEKVTALKTFLVETWDAINTAINEKIELVKATLSAAWDAIKTKAEEILNPWLTWWRDTVWEGARAAVNEKIELVKTILSTAWTAIKTKAEETINPFLTWWTSTVWEPIRAAVDTAMNGEHGVLTTFKAAIDGVKTTVDTVMDGIKTTWETIWGAITTAAKSPADALRVVTDAVQKLKDVMPDWLIPHSPTPFEMGIRGIADAVKTMQNRMSSFTSGMGDVPGALDDWLKAAISIAGVGSDWLDGLRWLAMHESSGIPTKVNPNDVNNIPNGPGPHAAGLLQTIPSTFAHYRNKDLPNEILNPIANAVAAIAYIQERYGSIGNVISGWERRGGYAAGGWAGLHGPELAWLGERGPEYVVPNAALRGGGSAGPMQSVSMPIVIGNRVIEELWITGRDLAIRRGRVPGAGAASMGSLA